MNVTGIIAEYNPFHKGHQYQLQYLREHTNTDYIIVIMSGDFLQRGMPALTDKYSRAKMALLGGADLVLELPVIFATASAELFAAGGIRLLNATGVTNTLCFGAETDRLEALMHIAHILAKESQEYTTILQYELKQGRSYPAARANALNRITSSSDLHGSSFDEILRMPNNILAIEYLKAIDKTQSPLTPLLLKRRGNGYHDGGLNLDFSSATAIRRQISAENSVLPLQAYLPEATYRILMEYEREACFLSENDFSLPLRCKLMNTTREELCQYLDSTPFLSNRILHNQDALVNWRQFLGLLKTKEVTYSRMSRLLLHILLEIHTEDLVRSQAALPPYLRVLGFRKEAAALLHEIKAKGSAPLITKVAASVKNLSADGIALIKKDFFASQLYRAAMTEKSQKSFPNEYRRKMLIL